MLLPFHVASDIGCMVGLLGVAAVVPCFFCYRARSVFVGCCFCHCVFLPLLCVASDAGMIFCLLRGCGMAHCCVFLLLMCVASVDMCCFCYLVGSGFVVWCFCCCVLLLLLCVASDSRMILCLL